jgi:AcrR family transcriptional regulator
MGDETASETANGRGGLHGSTRARGASATLRGARRSTQRERLLAAIIAVTAREGYAATTVALLIAEAGVSRRTFHEYFTDKEECFLTALKDARERLLADIRRAVVGQAERTYQLAIETLVAFAVTEPATARVLLSEAMAGGTAALDARDHAIDQIAQLIEASHEPVDPAAMLPDVSARILIGGVWRLLASRLRHAEPDMTGLAGELLEWTRRYEQPLGARRWRSLRPAPLPSPSPPSPNTTLHSSGALATHQGTSRKDSSTDNRARILAAVAALAEQQGYAATTITDIAKHAGLSSRAFYRSFADKREAFAALHEHDFRSVMGVTAGAFFAQAQWPARIWEAGLAFTRYLEQNPTLAYTSFIESYAGDPVSLQRVEELVAAFTMFLQEGYQYSQLEIPPSPLAVEAIATTIFELNYRYTRAGRVFELSALIPHSAFISLAPFLGPGDTNTFIDDQLSSARRQPAPDS